MHLISNSGSQRFQVIDTTPAGHGRRRGGKARVRCCLKEGTAFAPAALSGPEGLAAGGLSSLPGRKQRIVGSVVFVDIVCDDGSITSRLVLPSHVSCDGRWTSAASASHTTKCLICPPPHLGISQAELPSKSCRSLRLSFACMPVINEQPLRQTVPSGQLQMSLMQSVSPWLHEYTHSGSQALERPHLMQ